MLSPDDLSRAGEEVAAVYRQIEDSMVDALAGLLVSGETRSQRFETAMQLLSQSAVPRIHEVMERNRAHIDGATRSEVGRWLALSDSDDLSRIKAALGVELPGITAREAASVVEGVAGILSRDNLEMERGAAQAFLRHSTWAVTQVSSGAMTAHAAWREAAVNLAGEGITHVTYRDTASGRVTVTNHADVAVRRHIRSQLSQATMSRTLQVCREAGIGFVEVSSHTGARPTHAEWHGRVYSLDGDVTVDGKRYRDFWRGTGYQGKEGPYASLGDRLGGVNCRHAFGPWLPGTPRAYDPDPPHPSGLSNDEVYELTQKQRAQERRIRATKRELMVAREHADPGDLGDSVRVARLEKKLKRQQAGMRKLVDDANAKGKARVLTRAYPRESVVGYKPGGAIKASGRTLDEFMAMPGVEAARKRAGLTKAEFRRGMRAELEKRGLNTQDLPNLAKGQVAAMSDNVIASAPSIKSQLKQERRRKAAMADVPEFKTAEAKAVLGSTELAAKIDSDTVRKLASDVEDAMSSSDSARRNAARLFAADAKDGRLKIEVVPGAENSNYNMHTKTVTLNESGKASARTIFHEDAHLHDHQSTVAYKSEKPGGDGRRVVREHATSPSDWTTTWYGVERGGKTLANRLGRASRGGKGDTAAWRNLKKRLGVRTDSEARAAIRAKIEETGLLDSDGQYSKIKSLSDIVHAASNGKVEFGYGHWPKQRKRADGTVVMRDGKPVMDPYWNETTRVLEPWADFSASLLTNPREAALIRELFPDEAAIMDEIMEAMLR